MTVIWNNQIKIRSVTGTNRILHLYLRSCCDKKFDEYETAEKCVMYKVVHFLFRMYDVQSWFFFFP